MKFDNMSMTITKWRLLNTPTDVFGLSLWASRISFLGSLKFQGRGEHNENIIQTQIKLASNSRVMLDYHKNNFLSQR